MVLFVRAPASNSFHQKMPSQQQLYSWNSPPASKSFICKIFPQLAIASFTRAPASNSLPTQGQAIGLPAKACRRSVFDRYYAKWLCLFSGAQREFLALHGFPSVYFKRPSGLTSVMLLLWFSLAKSLKLTFSRSHCIPHLPISSTCEDLLISYCQQHQCPTLWGFIYLPSPHKTLPCPTSNPRALLRIPVVIN